MQSSGRLVRQPVYRIDVKRKLVALLWEVFPSFAEFREAVDQAVEDPEFKPGMNFLWDHEPNRSNTASIQYLRRTLHYLQLLAEGIGAHSFAIVGRSAAEVRRAPALDGVSGGS